MSSTTTYKGYKVLTPEPSKEGGQDLNYNFKKIGDDVESINASLDAQPLLLTEVTSGDAIVVNDGTVGTVALRGTSAVDLQSTRNASTQVASGNYSFIAGGSRNSALGTNSYAEGYSSTAIANYSHAEGNASTAKGLGSHAQGQTNIASGAYSHSEGGSSLSVGDYSHTEGFSTTAVGSASHSEGQLTTAVGNYSHAEGQSTISKDFYSHAEGFTTVAHGIASHAEGNTTTAIGSASHSEGNNTTAIGNYSHAEGYYTTAVGISAHSEGYYTTAIGDYSHSQGIYSVSNLKTQNSFSSGTFTYNNGDAQGSRVVAYGKTTSNSSTSIYVGNSSANRLVIPSDSTWTFSILVVGRNAGANEAAGYKVEGVIDNNGGTVALIGSVTTTTLGETVSGWDATAIADNVNKALDIKVTGSTSSNGVLWVAVVNLAQVTGTGVPTPP